MAKKALVSKIEPRGKNNSGYRVLEVVDPGNEFEVHSGLGEWKDCPDNVVMDFWWYDPATSSFKKLPGAVDPYADDPTDLAKDADGNYLEYHKWDWDTESYTREPI
jgi:hypothetical protein